VPPRGRIDRPDRIPRITRNFTVQLVHGTYRLLPRSGRGTLALCARSHTAGRGVTGCVHDQTLFGHRRSAGGAGRQLLLQALVLRPLALRRPPARRSLEGRPPKPCRLPPPSTSLRCSLRPLVLNWPAPVCIRRCGRQFGQFPYRESTRGDEQRKPGKGLQRDPCSRGRPPSVDHGHLTLPTWLANMTPVDDG
jgi:hypothetical protein